MPLILTTLVAIGVQAALLLRRGGKVAAGTEARAARARRRRGRSASSPDAPDAPRKGRAA
ncbi:MAG: hypothetical protein ACKO5R_07590 [Planctomycetaceae bacterium]